MGKIRRFEILGFLILPFSILMILILMILILKILFLRILILGACLGTVPGHGARARCPGTRPGTVARSQVWKYDFPTSDPCVLTGVVLRTLKQSLWEKFVGLKF